MKRQEYKVILLHKDYDLEWVVYERRLFFWKEVLRTDNWSDVTSFVHAAFLMDELKTITNQ